jgi:D-3-phosphoglycerate dehydrogenase
VDNVDVPAASKRGIIVMNTPFGNSITTAEHAVAMMLAVARQIPEASASTHAGKWEKSRFMGVELTGKTLGVIGAGNIGSIVIDRARGLRMKVLAYDPFLGQERADQMGVEKVELDDLLAAPTSSPSTSPDRPDPQHPVPRGHRPLKPGAASSTAPAAASWTRRPWPTRSRGPRRRRRLRRLRRGARDREPPLQPPQRRRHPPPRRRHHRGAGERGPPGRRADGRLPPHGAVSNALNMPSVTPRRPRHGPWIRLAGHLGNFVGQMTDEPITAINVLYDGVASTMNLQALDCAVIAGILRRWNPDVNLVSAPVIARERGIHVSTTRQDQAGVFEGYVKVTAVTDLRERSVAGTVFSDGKPRFIQIKGITVDAEIGRNMVYTTNEDVPGIIGALGQHHGRPRRQHRQLHPRPLRRGGEAIAILYVDDPVPEPILDDLRGRGSSSR